MDRKIYNTNLSRSSLKQDLKQKMRTSRLAEKFLKETEFLLHASQKMAHVGNCVIDMKTRTWIGTSEFDRIIGVDEVYTRSLEGLLRIIAPEYLDDFKKLISNTKKEFALFDFESKINRVKDGQACWVSGSGNIEYDNLLKPNRVLITAKDITEHKETENMLNTLYRAVEQSPVSIIITDHEKRIVYANPKASEISGYSDADLLGENPSIFAPDEETGQNRHELLVNISQGKGWQGLLQSKRKNGELYWESTTLSPIVNAQGLITVFYRV